MLMECAEGIHPLWMLGALFFGTAWGLCFGYLMGDKRPPYLGDDD